VKEGRGEGEGDAVWEELELASLSFPLSLFLLVDAFGKERRH